MFARFSHIAAALNSRKRTPLALLAVELEVTRKTVQRDVDFMRDRLGLPIAADGDGHFFAEPVLLCACCGRRKRKC